MMKQMGQAGEKAVDNMGMAVALKNALLDAEQCDKYDALPNAKGKVAPKFHKKLQEALWPLHPPRNRRSGRSREAKTRRLHSTSSELT